MRDFSKGERSLKNTIVPFKRFQKKFFLSEKHLVLSTNEQGKPSRPKIKSWVNPNKTLAIKKVFEGVGSLEENLNHLPQVK